VSLLMENFKRQSQYKFKPKGFPDRPLWRNMVGDETAFGADEIRVKLTDIHDNPVRAEYCEKPEDFLWSSAKEYANGSKGVITLTRAEADLSVVMDETALKLQTLRSHLQRMFSYDYWANRETIVSLKAMSSPPSKAVELMGHLLISQQFVYNLLTGQSNEGVQDRNPPTLIECEMMISELGQFWRNYLTELSSKTLQGFINFRNSRGEADRQAVSDLLTHAATHSHYHRAQIATLVRAGGGEPARTDYIVYARKHPQG
jgi:uncharacterized damage-inducible protein DinB